MKSKPSDPPPLVAMAARSVQLEFDRRTLFTKWMAALEAADGNVTRAAGAMVPPITRDRGNRLTRKFGLVGYARELRAAVLKNPQGRPYLKVSGSVRGPIKNPQ